jgi:hypothetical protein
MQDGYEFRGDYRVRIYSPDGRPASIATEWLIEPVRDYESDALVAWVGNVRLSRAPVKPLEPAVRTGD